MKSILQMAMRLRGTRSCVVKDSKSQLIVKRYRRVSFGQYSNHRPCVCSFMVKDELMSYTYEVNTGPCVPAILHVYSAWLNHENHFDKQLLRRLHTCHIKLMRITSLVLFFIFYFFFLIARYDEELQFV